MNLIKKILYFFPFIIGCIFYSFASISFGFKAIHYFAWITLIIFFISGFLMDKNKWWGSLLGFIMGAILIYMGTKETGQIIKETSFVLVMCIYYVVCGITCYRVRKKNN